MTMGKEEIKKSRKKLGISEPDKPNKIVCEAYGCSKIATGKCKYCNRYFCSYHLNPTISMSASYIHSLDGSDYEKYKKYNEDWQRKDGHPCVPYTEWWNENHIKQQREGYKEINKALDILFEGAGSSSKGDNTGRSNSDRFTEYRPSYVNNKRGNSYIKKIYDIWLLKHALIFAIILTIIATLPIGLLIMSGFSLDIALFTSNAFLIDFIVIFLLFLIYSKIATRKINYWTALSAGIIDTIIILYVINFASIKGIYNFAEVLLLLFLANYISFLIGKGISSETYNTKIKAAIYLARVLLILLAILILGNLSLHFSSYLRSSSSSLNQNGSIINKSLNVIGKINKGISLNLLLPKINGTWATEFFSNVSSERGMPYTYCANLSDFASKRFHTIAQHYGVSHYGYTADFNSTWPGGVEYGGEIYEGFGEEVFYPSGYNASNYVKYVITNAPLHWQELADKNLTSYGYNISNGPAYEILGPDGGYSECPVTEIPGSNINISQYFAQYGCSVETTNLTYFVIEIAPFCPYKGG
ncbi:MAG: hypothetical protein QXL94_06620 [Candidatus Parvarchaeum sp.]